MALEKTSAKLSISLTGAGMGRGEGEGVERGTMRLEEACICIVDCEGQGTNSFRLGSNRVSWLSKAG